MKSSRIVGLSLLVWAAGCGHADPDAEVLDEESSIGVHEQDLSSTESCDTVGSNKTTNGAPGEFKSSLSYGVSGCAHAYRIDAFDYVGVSGSSTHRFEYGGAAPTSKTECEKLRFGLYAWQKNLPVSPTGGIVGHVYVGSKWRWGEWSSNRCIVPFVSPTTDLNASAGESYRFAMSARQYSQPKDSSSSFSTKVLWSRWR